MAQNIPRYISEGKLPAYPAAPQVNPAAMTPETEVIIQAGQGIAGLGSKMLSFATAQAQEAKYSYDQATAIDTVNKFYLFADKYEADAPRDGDPKAWLDGFGPAADAQISDSMSKVSPNRREIVRAQLERLKIISTGNLNKVAAAVGIKQMNENFTATYGKAITNRDYEIAIMSVAGAVEGGLITARQGEAFYIEIQESKIKDNLVAAIGDTLDKDIGYKLLNKYYKSKSITAEQSKRLGDWMDSYTEGRRKKEVADKYNATIQTYQGFSQKLLTGEVTQDDVEAAGFDDKTKAAWQSIVKGSFKDAPTFANHEGISTIIADVMDFSTLKISKQEAYDSILKARFVDKSITDDDYTWAINRIENPYPKHVVENTQAVMKASEGFYRERGWFFGAEWIGKQEQQLLTAKKKAFLSWLDDEIEGGKVPGGKEMYAKMKEMEALAEEPVSAPGGMYGHSVVPPDPNDPLYITTDEQFDKIPEETAFYYSLTGQWRYKPKKSQESQESEGSKESRPKPFPRYLPVSKF